jgi:hypothetical protein
VVTKIGSDTVTGYNNGNAFVSFVFFFFYTKVRRSGAWAWVGSRAREATDQLTERPNGRGSASLRLDNRKVKECNERAFLSN